VPALPPYNIIEPIWQQFEALLPEHHTDHPLGCHRSRIPDRVVFEKLIQILVFGCAYSRGSPTSLARRARCVEKARRVDRAGADGDPQGDLPRRLRPSHRPGAFGGGGGRVCLTKAPCGGEKAGKSPVDRRKMGIKRSMAVDASGIPVGTVTAPAKAATTRRSWSRPWRRCSRRSAGCPRRRASTWTVATTPNGPASGSRRWG
jgi:transposase